MAAGLEGIPIDLIEGNLARLAALKLGRGSGNSGYARQQRVQAFTQGATFWFGILYSGGVGRGF
jgi:hypothetical protein